MFTTHDYSFNEKKKTYFCYECENSFSFEETIFNNVESTCTRRLFGSMVLQTQKCFLISSILYKN